MKRVALFASLLAAACLGFLIWTKSPEEPAPMAPAPADIDSPKAVAAAREPADAADASTLAEALNSPSGTIATDLKIVADVLEAFRSNFLRTGNPVGENAEITAALTGRNPLKLALIPATHPAISRQGELCDRWGTPFFFHQLSGTRMEIRSAGPDKKLHTGDDTVFTP